MPNKIKGYAEMRQRTALKDSWLEGEKEDLLGFVDFGMLTEIRFKQIMDELEKTRNFIAHN
ncbi:hypothetical protein [Ornithinibacillus bavariensis]|uniref:Uncharacterized protein n=1 Tax=Ornithinibacillus bavariensis TaxID=545502 RepID=A0A919X9F0_9BACI|nr:hypothetical protein [Ornithinibacillus bavariensis]GIO28279.1 hypothetical protein J43TS3_28900 [Ornithinibacillus bavariensis]